MVEPTNLKPRFSAPLRGRRRPVVVGISAVVAAWGDLWLILDERPDKVAKRFAALFHGQEGAGVANNGLNFPRWRIIPASGAGARYLPHSWRRREPDRTDERPAIIFTLFQHRNPRQTGLLALKADHFEQFAGISLRNAPLVIMVLDVKRVWLTQPQRCMSLSL